MIYKVSRAFMKIINLISGTLSFSGITKHQGARVSGLMVKEF